MSAPAHAAPGRVLSPHAALSGGELERRSILVGGRLLCDGPSVRIADAFAAIAVEGLASPPAHGSLVLLEGQLAGGAGTLRLCGARLVQIQHSPATGGLPPDFQRMLEAGVGQNLLARARVFALVRGFFAGAGFLEVDTPIRSEECSTEPHIEPLACSGGYLVTSPELHMKRLLVAGVPKLFQLVHCFRAEELGALHAPEFALLEWYRAFADYDVIMADTEQLLHYLCRQLGGSAELPLPSGSSVDLTPPFARCTVRDAFARHAGVDDAAALARDDEDRYFQLLVDRVEPALAKYEQPVFLYEYPASQAALARRCPHDATVAERFELYLAGVELCNGYGELTLAKEQRARCEQEREQRRAMGRHVPAVPRRFLEALDAGMPPASGNAVGLERVIALLCGEKRIAAVSPFEPDTA